MCYKIDSSVLNTNCEIHDPKGPWMTVNALAQSQRNNTWSSVPECKAALVAYLHWPLGQSRPWASRAYLTLTLAYGNLDLHITLLLSSGLHLFQASMDPWESSGTETSPWWSICFLTRGQSRVVIRTELDPPA